MKKISKVSIVLCLIVFVCLLFTGCMTNRHVIGSGPTTYETEKQVQWYILWGIVPMGNVDTNSMAQNSQNYEIKTYYGFINGVINIFLGAFSIQSRTVTVTR